jgi:hypothetical protein
VGISGTEFGRWYRKKDATMAVPKTKNAIPRVPIRIL